MKLTQPTTLRVEDYPEEASWIGRLFNVVNPVLTQIQQIFDSNIDFATNIRSVTRDFDTTSITFPLKFAWPYTQANPGELAVIQATNQMLPTSLLAAWSFDASKREVSIDYLTEVTTSAIKAVASGPRYKFTVRVTV